MTSIARNGISAQAHGAGLSWSVWCLCYRASQIEFPLPPLSGPASHTRGVHLLVLKDVPMMQGVMRHIVPRDTDTPYSTCYTRYL